MLLPSRFPNEPHPPVPVQSRLRGPALVCRRLCEVTNTPQLNASASLHLWGEPAKQAAGSRVLSFSRWLAARAGIVQWVSFQLTPWGIKLPANATDALGSALDACNSGALQHLALSVPNDVLHRLSSWVAALRGLRGLKLGGGCFTRSLARLTQLEALELDSITLASHLPPSLTWLHFEGDCGWEMPQQV